MRLLGEVLLDILACLDRDGWDTLQLVSLALKDSVGAAVNSPSRVHYRRIEKVSCSGCDTLLSVELSGKTYSFDVFNRYVFHCAFVKEFLVGSATTEEYPSVEFALALPHVVRTVAVRTLTFKKLHFCRWKRNGDFCEDETGSSAFEGLVMSFGRIDRLAFTAEDNFCIVKPDYMTDGFIRRCKIKGVRQFDAILCRTDVTGEGEDDPRWAGFDISANAVVDFVSGPEGEDQEIVFKLGFFLHPISVLQRLTLAFEQGRIPQRFRVAFLGGPYAQVRSAVREWYAACFMEEKDDADLYHLPSVDFVLYVVDAGLLVARHVDPVTFSWSFISCFEVDHLRAK